MADKISISPEQQARADARAQQAALNEAKAKKDVDNAKSRDDIQYTMFVSGLKRGRMSELENKNQTDDLAIIFDAVINHNYTKDYNKSSYAVESKARASDHVTTQDGKFTFSAKITDSPHSIDQRNYLDRDTDKDNPVASRRPAKAVEILQRVADSHQLITLVTEDNILTNYVITNFSFNRSTEEGSAIAVDLTLEEFRFKSISKTVLAKTVDAKKAGPANSGTKQTAEGGAVDDAAKGKRKSPYLSKKAETVESWETAVIGTEDFSGAPGKKFEFDPNNLKRK